MTSAAEKRETLDDAAKRRLAERYSVHGRFVRGEDNTWPLWWEVDADSDGVEWKLRYAPDRLSRSDMLLCASIVAAYRALGNGPRETYARFRRLIRFAKEAPNG